MRDISKDLDKVQTRVSNIFANQSTVKYKGDGLFELSIRHNLYKRVVKLVNGLLNHEDVIAAHIAKAMVFNFMHDGSRIAVYIGDIIGAETESTIVDFSAQDMVTIKAIDDFLASECLSNMLSKRQDFSGIANRKDLLAFRS